jgi:ApaG protein
VKTPVPHNISIEVASEFIAVKSSPDEDYYAFAYHIAIHNDGAAAIRIVSRHWIITDGDDQVHEVHGLGVIGEQPHLAPGEVFRYSSGCVLDTPVGTMQGHYLMETDDGQRFEVEIPAFMLATPGVLH